MPKSDKQVSDVNTAGEGTIWTHVNELRKRLLWVVIGLVVFVGLSFLVVEPLLNFLARPIGASKLQAIEITENISSMMRIVLLSGFILSLPFTFYQIYAFAAPGLTAREKLWVYIAIPAATILFLAGTAFSYFVMLPTALPFLTTLLGVETTPRLSSYIAFVTQLIFWTGLVFETPLIIYILAKLKLVSSKVLIKQWRIALVVIAIAAAVITPTGDPVNMGLLMLPLLFIYFFSAFLAWIARRNEI